jgi:hypothetical protein
MKTKQLFLWMLFTVLLIFVSGDVIAGSTTGNKEGAKKNSSVLKFKKFNYIDKEGAGIEAFHFLMPADWRFEGGIRWVLDKPTMPASVGFRVFDPRGTAEFEVFPNQNFFWTNNPTILSLFPAGSRYFGNEIRQPVPAQKALVAIVLPRFRQRYGGMKIIKQQDVPELAKAVGAGAPQAGATTSADAAKVRIEYQKNGVMMEEEIYCVVETMTFSTQSMYGPVSSTYWFTEYLFSFKAEKGKGEPFVKVLQTIAYSFRLNPAWYAKYSRMIEYLAQRQIRQIQSVGQISRMLSQMSDQMSRENLAQFEKRQAVNDKLSENFSDYVRGVDKYIDPYEGKAVDMPSGYNHAWVNNNGEYIVTDNPNFNPNVESNLHWQEMQKK